MKLFSYSLFIMHIVYITSQTQTLDNQFQKFQKQLSEKKQSHKIENKQYLKNQLQQSNQKNKLALYHQNYFAIRNLQTCNSSAFYQFSICWSCNKYVSNCQTCDSTGRICNSCFNGSIKNSSSQCLSCAVLFSYCQICNLTHCLTCTAGTLISGRCCQILQYYNTTSDLCDICSNKFVKCSTCSPTICYTCLSGNYYNSPNSSCLACNIKFQSCSTCNSTQCLSCSSGALRQGICCPSTGYFKTAINTCDACGNLIKNCNLCNLSQCFACSIGTFTSGICCASNQYYNKNNTCDSCLNKFSYCNTCNQTQCLTCSSGILKSGICCLSNQYYNNNNTCDSCLNKFSYCNTCNQTQCLTCSSGILTSGICCLSNQYFNNNNTCEACLNKFVYCNTCIKTQCITCSSGTLISGICCSLNQYYSSINIACEDCLNKFAYCNTCNLTQCLSCSTGTLFSGICCLSTQYYDSVIFNCNACVNKFAYCSACNSTQCLTCSLGTLMSGLCCLSNQYYNSSNSICDNCLNKFSYCNTCDFTQCLTCSSGTLISGHCCLSNQYYNSTIIACDSCSHKYLGCGTCNSLNCLSCLQGYFYNVTFKNCAVCSVKFALCGLCDSTQCLNCLEGALTSGKCSCLQTQLYIQINNSCDQCSSRFPNCKTCDQSICSSCLTGPLHFGICCAGNEYYSLISDSCLNCPAYCLKCTNGVCLLCDNQFFLLLNTCIRQSKDADVKSLAKTTGKVTNNTVGSPFTGMLIKNSAVKSTLNTALGLLGSIDDLWIFSYHERNYTLTIALLLNSIRELQSSKFNAFSKVQSISNFTNNIINYFNNLTIYGKQRYVAIEMKGSDFYQNIVQFIVMTVPQNIVIFLIFRLFFKLFFNSKVSKIFREYTFNCYFFFSLLEGNTQFFTYICSNQLQVFFHFNISTKIWNLMFVFILFWFIQAFLTIYFMLDYFYKNQATYFMENHKNTIYSIFLLIIVSTFRNITIAVISSFSAKDYEDMINLMNFTQLGFILVLISSLIISKCFKSKMKFWITLIFAILRLTIQLSFTNLRIYSANEDIQQKIQSTIFIIYLFYWIFTILIFIFKLFLPKILPINKQQKHKITQQIKSIDDVKPLTRLYKNLNRLRISVNINLKSRFSKIQQVKNISFQKNSQIKQNNKQSQQMNEAQMNNQMIDNKKSEKKQYEHKFSKIIFKKQNDKKTNKIESTLKQNRKSINLSKFSKMRRIVKSPQLNPNYLLIRKSIQFNK